MQWLVEIGLSNAVVAVVLAMVAWGVGVLLRRPAVTHALCVLVLLKLLTPPIIELPLPLPFGQVSVNSEVGGASALQKPGPRQYDVGNFAAQPERHRDGRDRDSQSERYVRVPVPNPTSGVFAAVRAVADSSSGIERYVNERQEDAAPPLPAAAARRSSLNADKQEGSLGDWMPAATASTKYLSWALLRRPLMGAWLTGMVAWFCLQMILGLRLRAVLRRSVPAPLEVRKTALRLARRMGLERSPSVVSVAETTSPMLCGVGRNACIVIPDKLLHRLSPEALAAVLSHELAHFRRGDQWVRLIELIATGLYWWHPAVWWVRRRIEDTEEQCCDAHVLAESGGRPRVYAEAILDIVDFVSELPGRIRPVLSSGIRQRPMLKRRLTDLMEGNCVPDIAPNVRRLVAIAGALCLLHHPTFFLTPADGAYATPAGRVVPSAEDAGEARLEEQLSRRPSAGESSARQSAPAPPMPWPFEFGSAPSREVWATAISPNGRYQVSVRAGYECELREVVNSHVRKLTKHEIVCIAFSPDSVHFVTGGRDGTVRLWDAASGSELEVLQRRQGPIYSLAFSPAGDTLAVAGEDGAVRILTLTYRREDPRVVQVGAAVRCVRFSPNGRRLVVAVDTWHASEGGKVVVYDLRSQRVAHQWQTHAPIGAVHYLADDCVLAADWSGRIVGWSMRRPLGSYATAVAKELVSAASFSPDTRAFEAVAEELETSLASEQKAEDRI